MHPIEHLRWVARSPEGEVAGVVAEAAAALASFGDEPAGLVTACRRLIQRRPECGPLWWLCARVLCAFDPDVEAYEALAEIEGDQTPQRLATALPSGTVVVDGWPEQAALALASRPPGPDDAVVVVGSRPVRSRRGHWIERAGLHVITVGPEQASEVLDAAELLLLEAEAVGPSGFVTAGRAAPSLAVAARAARVPVWLMAGPGHTLPGPMFEALAGRARARGLHVLDIGVLDAVAGPAGMLAPATAARRATCPVAPELLRF